MDTNLKSQQEDLKHIKEMMERSSRFISLSGLSGVAAGICALVGAYFANGVITNSIQGYSTKSVTNVYSENIYSSYGFIDFMGHKLFLIAAITFISALISAFLFTWIRSKKNNTPLLGKSSLRLATNMGIPLAVGGVYLLKLIENQAFGLIAPGCLIFYGLALLNASKYTLVEIKYLGYLQILLGLLSLWFIGKGIYFWAFGFGILHIVYGIFMWNKYERN